MFSSRNTASTSPAWRSPSNSARGSGRLAALPRRRSVDVPGRHENRQRGLREDLQLHVDEVVLQDGDHEQRAEQGVLDPAAAAPLRRLARDAAQEQVDVLAGADLRARDPLQVREQLLARFGRRLRAGPPLADFLQPRRDLFAGVLPAFSIGLDGASLSLGCARPADLHGTKHPFNALRISRKVPWGEGMQPIYGALVSARLGRLPGGQRRVRRDPSG